MTVRLEMFSFMPLWTKITPTLNFFEGGLDNPFSHWLAQFYDCEKTIDDDNPNMLFLWTYSAIQDMLPRFYTLVCWRQTELQSGRRTLKTI